MTTVRKGAVAEQAGGNVAPPTSDWEISADLPGIKEARKKGKRGEN